MKKYLLYILILTTLAGFFGSVLETHASTSNPGESCIDEKGNSVKEEGSAVNAPCGRYVLLAPLPEIDPNFNPKQDSALGSYLNTMIKVFIGLCAVLAVVMIVMGGLEYMTSELISNKEAGKEKIRGALLGLLIALGAYALLFTINPDLLDSEPTIPARVS